MTTRSAARRRKGSHPIAQRVDVRKPVYSSSTPITQRANPRPDDIINFWRGLHPKPLFVYVIQHDDGGPVKIGRAHDPLARLTELQCGNPYPLNLRHVLLAAPHTEAAIHQAWWFARNGGEWFSGGHQVNILKRARDTQNRQIRAANSSTLSEITHMAVEGLTP